MFTRAGDIINVVFVREPCNLFNPSCVKVCLRGQVCIHFLRYLVARISSIINQLGTLRENSVKCSIFCVLCNYDEKTLIKRVNGRR